MKKAFGCALCILLAAVMLLSGCHNHDRTYTGTAVDFMDNLVHDPSQGYVVLWQDRPTAYRRMSSVINTLAPTWLFVNATESGYVLQSTNETGAEVSYASFVTQANKDSISVWAGAVCSGEEATAAVLKDEESRNAFTEKIVTFAADSGVDGINLVFQDLEKNQKEDFVSLVRKVRNELPLSVMLNTCVYPEQTSNATVSDSAYDYEELGEICNHLLLMAYEQFGLESTTAGPTCSYDWLYNKVLKILSVVPSNKLVLILPFFGRDYRFDESGTAKWIEDPTQAPIVSYAQVAELYEQQQYFDSNEQLATSAEQDLTETWDDTYSACFVKFKDTENVTHVIWYDNDVSIQKKADIAIQYGLAGIGVFRDAYADSFLWKGVRRAMDGSYFSERIMQMMRLHAFDFRVFNPDDEDWTEGDDVSRKRILNLISVSRPGASSGVETGYILSAMIREDQDAKGNELSWLVKEKNGQYILVPNNEYTMIVTSGQSLWLPTGVTPQMLEGACMVLQKVSQGTQDTSEQEIPETEEDTQNN